MRQNEGCLLAIAFELNLLAGSGYLTSRMGAEFIPKLNEDDIAMHALPIPGVSFCQSIGMPNPYALTPE